MRTELVAWLKYCWKSVAAFLALLTTNIATRWIVNGEPLPETGKDWLVFGATTAAGTWLVFAKANGPNPAVGKHVKPEQ